LALTNDENHGTESWLTGAIYQSVNPQYYMYAMHFFPYASGVTCRHWAAVLVMHRYKYLCINRATMEPVSAIHNELNRNELYITAIQLTRRVLRIGAELQHIQTNKANKLGSGTLFNLYIPHQQANYKMSMQ